MLTIFAVPKAFKGQFAHIQRNAIQSWTLLNPRPEIILLGDDEGTAEVCQELGLRHHPTVERNSFGTPLTRGVFRLGQELASNDLVAYVNSDIILGSDFMGMVRRVVVAFPDQQFLTIGRKSTIPLETQPHLEHPNWEADLHDLARRQGHYPTYDSDFFVFRRPMFRGMPDFTIGRCFWTQWLIYYARTGGVPVIDVTPVVTSVEPRHDYSHAASTGGVKRLSGVEYESNRRLFSGCKYFTTLDSTHILTPTGLKRRPGRDRLLSTWVRFDYFVYFLLKGTLYPYSIPLILLGRWIRQGLSGVRSVFRHLAHVLNA